MLNSRTLFIRAPRSLTSSSKRLKIAAAGNPIQLLPVPLQTSELENTIMQCRACQKPRRENTSARVSLLQKRCYYRPSATNFGGCHMRTDARTKTIIIKSTCTTYAIRIIESLAMTGKLTGEGNAKLRRGHHNFIQLYNGNVKPNNLAKFT